MKFWLLGLSALLAVVACTPPADTAQAKPAGAPLNIALVPSEDAEKMVQGFEPVRARLEATLKRPVNVLKVTDYTSVIEALRSERVDVAWLGPLSMVLAQQVAGAEPLAIAVVEGKGESYHSLIVVPASSPIQSVDDLAGKRVSFVDPGSTSGNLLPRYALKQATGKQAEDFLKEVVYAGSHDASLLALKSGSVDACAVQDITFESQIEKGEIKREDYRIIHKSDPLPQSPLATRKGLESGLRDEILAGLVGIDGQGMSLEIPGLGKIQRFVPVTSGAYEPIAAMAKMLGLTPDELAK